MPCVSHANVHPPSLHPDAACVCGGILQELWAEAKATKDAALVIAARPTADEVARLTHALRGSARPSEPDLRLLEQEAEADKRPRGWFEKSIFANEVGW